MTASSEAVQFTGGDLCTDSQPTWHLVIFVNTFVCHNWCGDGGSGDGGGGGGVCT